MYSLALGTGEVSLLEITSAYGTLAAGGVRAEPIFVKSVYDRDGKLLEENPVYREEVLSPQSSFLITIYGIHWRPLSNFRLLDASVNDCCRVLRNRLSRPHRGATGWCQVWSAA